MPPLKSARLALLLLAFCGPVLALCAPALAQTRPLVVGAAMPQSGLFADLAADLRKSLLLWQEEVNAAGGLLGRHVELELLDDRSESMHESKLYEQLVSDRKVDLLFGPLGSAASLGAAGVAERHRRVLVNATGAARSTQKPSFRYTFQVPAPLSAYGTGALELAKQLGLKRIVIAARDDPSSKECAQLMQEQAIAAGLASLLEPYDAGSEDFTLQVKRAKARGVEGWIAFGLPQDAAEMVKSFRRLGFAPRLVVLQGASDPDFIKRIGQDAEYAVGITTYLTGAKTHDNDKFRQSYAKKWSAEPGALAAEGYGAAKVMEEAVRRAGTVESEKLREAFSTLEMATPLGPYKVDRSGAQIAATPMLVQILRGRRRIVWPESLAAARLQPYPAWEDRKPIK